MGIGSWIDGKLNQSILATSEKTLAATMARANLDEHFCYGLTRELSNGLSGLFPRIAPINSANLYAVDAALTDAHPSRLEDLATKLMDMSNRMQKEGMHEAAAASGTIAGWLKASALAQTSGEGMRDRAASLQDQYHKWVYVLLV